MRDHNKAFCRLVAETFDCPGPVFEFGSYQVEGQEGYANLRRALPGSRLRRLRHAARARGGSGRGRDGDPPARSLRRDGALHRDVRARLRGPEGVRRGLPHPQARAESSSSRLPLNFRIHAYPDDYWRMTPSCLRRMLEPYGARVSGYQGYQAFPHTVMGLGIKTPAPADAAAKASRLVSAYVDWARARGGRPAGRGEAATAGFPHLPVERRAAPGGRLLRGRLPDRSRVGFTAGAGSANPRSTPQPDEPDSQGSPIGTRGC